MTKKMLMRLDGVVMMTMMGLFISINYKCRSTNNSANKKKKCIQLFDTRKNVKENFKNFYFI